MTTRKTYLVLAITVLGAWTSDARVVAEPAAGKPARSRIALSRSLSPMDGRRLKATIVELAYEPGGSSPAHSHPCPTMVYVIEGAIRTRLAGEPEAIYRAGDTFYEAANGVHELSANASNQAPAKFLAIFVCEGDATLSVPPPAATGSK